MLADQGLDAGALVLLEERAEVDALLGLDDLVDMIIARGSSSFIHHVRGQEPHPGDGPRRRHLPRLPARRRRSRQGGAGGARFEGQYPAACNAVETLLWEPRAAAALDACVSALGKAGVELRGCPATRHRHPDMTAATEDDWDTEYGAHGAVHQAGGGLDQALAHIENHGSRHTDAIVTDDEAAAARFLAEVDAACVFHNASTRFTDGYRFGLGAEVGISTDKLHARGPVGVEGLLTYRWLLHGDGQTTADYGPGGKRFQHRDLD